MNQDKIILVFELRAILASSSRDWQQFKSVGSCILPEVVKNELEFLTKRATTSEEETSARQFMRFWADSGWESSNLTSTFENLSARQGENMSKNARLQLATAEGVGALAVHHSTDKVILVSNNPNLSKDMEKLGLDNLIVIPLTQLLQWVRTNQAPLALTKITGHNHLIPPPLKNTSSEPSYTYNPKAKVKKSQNILTGVIPSILTILGLIFVGGLSWYFVQPESFQKFWQEKGILPPD